MDIDCTRWKIIFLIGPILLWLPQLLITDALQVENNNTHSCDENETVIDSYRNQWPAPFEPYEISSAQNEFTPAVTSASSYLPVNSIRVTPKLPSKSVKLTPSPSSHRISTPVTPTPVIRLLVSSVVPSLSLPLDQLPSLSLQSKHLSPPSSADDDDSLSSLLLLPSMVVAPTPLAPSSSVQSTPTIELIVNSRQLISSLNNLQSSSPSSPIQSSPVVVNAISSLSSSPSQPIVNDSVTFPLHSSHTVIHDIPAHHSHHHHHGQQPSGSQLIYRVMSTVIATSNNLPVDLLTTTTTNYDDGTFVNMQSAPPQPPTTLDFSSSLANPKDHSEIINETSSSHNLSPTPSSFFPALSGTISFIPNDPTTITTDSPTTDFTFPWTSPIDNIYYNNQTNNNEGVDDGNSQNHHGIPEAATSNTTKCDHRGNRFTQPAPESGFLVRSVLKRFNEESPLSLDNLTTIFETRLGDIFNLAYRNQLKGLKVHPDGIKNDLHVKLWNLFWNNLTNDFHLIYSIEQDNHKVLAQDLQTLLGHISPGEMSTILGYNGTIKAEPYVSTSESKGNLASALEDLDWLPLAMIFLSLVVFIFCTLVTLLTWRKNRRLRSSSPASSSIGALGPPPGLMGARLKTKSSMVKSGSKVNAKESLVNWRKVSGPGSKRSFLGSHGGSGVGLNLSGGCSATSGTIDSNHEFEYLSFDSPTSSLKLRTAEYRPRRSYSGFPNHGSQSRLELAKEKVIPIGELDEIAELSSNSSHDAHPHHHRHHPNLNHHPAQQQQQQHQPGSRVTYVTTKEEMIGDYENPLMRPGVDEVDCSVPQLIQVHISEQTQNIIQAIRSELKKFNPITGTNVQSQSQSISTQLKGSTSTSDA